MFSFFFVCNGDHRITCFKVLFCQIVDEPKLLITVRASARQPAAFLVHLLAVPHVCEQLGHFDITDLYPVFINQDGLDFSEAHALWNPVEHFEGHRKSARQ